MKNETKTGFLKMFLQSILALLKFVFPKNRIANLIYLILGYLLSHWDILTQFIEGVVQIIKNLQNGI